jgi:cellulose synthase/poly-beta-1,6-N-acetylglucosamine synthase-like glycosyltransferase
MMNTAAYALSIIICLIASVDALLAMSLYGRLRKWRPASKPDTTLPWVTVVLSLRGSDPFLRDCLDALVQLDYEPYDIRVVVDRPNDSASEIVQTWRDAYPDRPIAIEFLTSRATTCSLKCAALVQVITSLRPETDIVAFLDADVIPHATWLQELVAPFEDRMVGAVSGCRWYLPSSESFGAILRSQWNSGATAIMVFNNIAWGGCLALRKSAIHPARIVERWKTALTEDIMLSNIIRHANLKLRIVPELMMVQKTCTAAQT